MSQKSVIGVRLESVARRLGWRQSRRYLSIDRLVLMMLMFKTMIMMTMINTVMIMTMMCDKHLPCSVDLCSVVHAHCAVVRWWWYWGGGGWRHCSSQVQVQLFIFIMKTSCVHCTLCSCLWLNIDVFKIVCRCFFLLLQMVTSRALVNDKYS